MHAHTITICWKWSNIRKIVSVRALLLSAQKPMYVYMYVCMRPRLLMVVLRPSLLCAYIALSLFSFLFFLFFAPKQHKCIVFIIYNIYLRIIYQPSVKSYIFYRNWSYSFNEPCLCDVKRWTIFDKTIKLNWMSRNSQRRRPASPIHSIARTHACLFWYWLCT